MAILDSEKIDFLWKKIIFGVSKTASAVVKFGSNEIIPSPAPVLPSSVWTDGDSIPAAPAVNDILQPYTGADRIQMTADPTSPANVAWIATSAAGDVTTRLTNFVPTTFGSGYAAQVWIGDPNVGPAARIFPDTTNEEWVFDYGAGALVFVGTIPSGKAATVGSGNVSVAANGVYLIGYRYIGSTGVGGGGGGDSNVHDLGDLEDVELGTGTPNDGDVLTYQDGVWIPASATAGGLGTIATQDADAVAITGGDISNVTLTNVTIDAGEYT